MKKLLPSDKDMGWYLDQMDSHVKEIRELVDSGEKPYKAHNGEETCRDHARVEAYDLIVLAAEAFGMHEILSAVPDEIIDRFNKKRK